MEILIIIGLILLNGLFAMAELALVAARTSRLQERAMQGSSGALTALRLKDKPEQFLSTIQIGITLIGVLTGAFGGASVAQLLSGHLRGIPLLAPYAEGLSVGIVVVIITYLTLIFGELAPKRLALKNPESMSAALAPWLHRLSRWSTPLVWLLSISTRAVLLLLGNDAIAEPPVSDAEIRLLMDQGTEAGVFEVLESEMVDGVLRLGDQRARSLMTPRHAIVWLNLQDPEAETLHKLRTSGYSRFPVCDGSLDNILGLVYTRDLLTHLLDGDSLDLRATLRQPLYVPEPLPALDLLARFRESPTHVALVLDEYGSVEGLLTLHDVLEGIAGDILSGGIVNGPLAVQRADDSWLLDGDYPADELLGLLNLHTLPKREQMGYETVAGLLLALLDHIPHKGERASWDGWQFEVVDMDGLRVDQVLVARTTEKRA